MFTTLYRDSAACVHNNYKMIGVLIMKRYIKSSASISTDAVFQYAESGIVGIVSAFRGYLSDEENNNRTDQLCKMVHGAGYDYAEVIGAFREAGGEVSRERSIVVINPSPATQSELANFRKIMTGFGASFQQDSIFIIYNKASEPSAHKNTTYVDEYGTSSNSKTYHYDKIDDNDDIDYSDYTYKETLRKSDRINRTDVEDGFDIVGELWERTPKYEWGSPESVNESVKRSEYKTLRKFTHITPRIAFAAYSETIDGGAYSIFASTDATYAPSYLRMQAKQCSGYASRTAITANRRHIIFTTE